MIFISIKQSDYLRRYYNMLYPNELRKNEYVCLFLIKNSKNGEEIKFHKFVKNIEQYLEIVRKYKHNYHMYNALATVKVDKSGNLKRAKANMRQKRVLFFDFDKKDFPNLRDARDFSKQIKDKFPDLFLHAYYDSGHGYHFYTIVPPTCDIESLTRLNKDIATLVGADTNACQMTQVARIPCTFNFKRANDDGMYPMVKEIDHYAKHPYALKNFHPCSTAHIKRRVEYLKKLDESASPQKPLHTWDYGASDGLDIPIYPSLCTQRALKEGADKHQRNIWLGRIISMLLSQGFTESKTREMCMDWNARCRPPKPFAQISDEINRYLQMRDIYKLNGCYDKISDPRVSEIVAQKCDRLYCMQAVQKRSITLEEDVGVKMSQKILTKNNLQRDGKKELSGFEYLIITVIYKYMKPYSRRPFTVKDLKIKMQYKKNGKWQLCMDLQNFKSTLQSLIEHNCIELLEPTPEQCAKKIPTFDDSIILIKKRLRNLSDRYIEFYYSAARAFICKQITANEFKVFLCIVNNMKNGKSCTMEDLDSTLNIGVPNIVRAINSLKNAQCIDVVQYRSDKGNPYNLYSHRDTNKWDDITYMDNIGVDTPKGDEVVIRLLA